MFYIEDIRNAKANNTEGASISCEIKFSDCSDYLPYHAASFDPDENGRKIYEVVKSEQFCKIAPFTKEDKLEKIRLDNNHVRSQLLLEADSIIRPLMAYVLAEIISKEDKARFKAWNEYRKALEDVDVTAADIEWPAKPA